MNRELIAKIVKLGVPKVKAEQIVKNSSAQEKPSALKDASTLRAIIEIDS